MFELFLEISFLELFSDKPSVYNPSDGFLAGITVYAARLVVIHVADRASACCSTV